MKILIWVLNIIQFLIVYFLVFWLLHAGTIVYPGPSGLSLEGLWPAISIGIAGIPWRYYKRFSLFITSKKIKAPTEEVVAEEASYTNEKKEEIIIREVKKTKPMSILKKILVTIISLVLIIILILVGVISYEESRGDTGSNPRSNPRSNPKSEHFIFPHYNYNNGTVEVDDIRYLKKDMSLFSGKLNGQYGKKSYYEVNYLNGRLNGDYYLWDQQGWLKITSYKDGKIDGPDKEWYRSNSQSIQGQLKLIAFYNDGLKQGDWKEWLPNGRLNKHWVMKDGIAVEKKVN